MAMRISCLFILFLLSSGLVHSQDRMRFRSSVAAGWLVGDKGNALELHSVNGVSNRDWFAGVGVGWDRYRMESVPVYLSVSRAFGLKRYAFFMSLDGGANFSKLSPGLYGRSGLGLKLNIPKLRSSVLMDLGFSYKQSRDKKWVQVPCLVPPCPEFQEKYNYQFNRFSWRVGWQF